MGIMKRVIKADTTILPGMKTVMADFTDQHRVYYFPNIKYVERDGKDLHLQLLLPQGMLPGIESRRRFPLVVYVQGAGWQEQDMFHNIPQLVMLARQGYVVASVKHRSSCEAQFPAHVQDVKSAIRFLRKNADQYLINPDEVAIWGDSSGGHTALMVGVTGDMEQFKTDDNREISDAVKAVVDFYGPTDTARFHDFPRNPEYEQDMANSPENILFGGRVDLNPELAAPGNPLAYVSRDRELPPFLIVHGDYDSVVPFNQSVLMVQKLQECGKEVEFYKVCGGEHGFYLWTDEILEIVDHFLRAYLETDRP